MPAPLSLVHSFTSTLAISPEFVRANQAEAAVWWLIALVFAWSAWQQTGLRRRQCLLAMATFLAFGLSDIVETHTGAWWRPWWLLAWKTACVAAMVWLLWKTGSKGARDRGSEQEGTGNRETGTERKDA